jgi:polyisoprenoid-binding protein YceI
LELRERTRLKFILSTTRHTDIRFTYGVGFISHSGHFTEVGGTFVYDARAPERGGRDALIKSASLSADSFETELKSSDFFNVAVFPEIRFKSRSVTPTGGKSVTTS